MRLKRSPIDTRAAGRVEPGATALREFVPGRDDEGPVGEGGAGIQGPLGGGIDALAFSLAPDPTGRFGGGGGFGGGGAGGSW